MKRILVVFILTIGLTNFVKPDTVDFWHVYYNGVKIKEFHQYSKDKEIILKIKDIKENDLLTIVYFNDFLYTFDFPEKFDDFLYTLDFTETITYFNDFSYRKDYTSCRTKVEIEDSDGFVIVERVIRNRVLEGAPVKILLFDLLVNAKKSPFFAYYYACTMEGRPKILLFKIEFE
jgi:hypothetical protein